MKRKYIGIFVVMLFITTTALPVLGTNDKDIEIEKKMIDIEDNVKSMIHPELAFLFGRVENKHSGGIGWQCEAVNLRVMNFGSLEYHHYSNYEYIEIGKPGLGFFTNRFIFGFYMIM
jgi:hypothetical protein